MVNLALVVVVNLAILTASCVFATETASIMDLRQYKKCTTQSPAIASVAADVQQMRNKKNNNYRAILREGGLYGRVTQLNRRMLSKLTKIDQIKGLSARKKKKIMAFALRSAAIKRQNKHYKKFAGCKNTGSLKQSHFLGAKNFVSQGMIMTKQN